METLFNQLISLCQNGGMSKDTTMHIVISEELKRQFKAACVMKGVNMSDIVCQLVSEWLDKEKTSSPESQKKSS